jgi:ATP-dependent DNA ligase
MPRKVTARFIEPMLLLRTDALPKDADQWEYQLKLDGYRVVAFKTRGRVHLRSRNDNVSASAIRPSSRALRRCQTRR